MTREEAKKEIEKVFEPAFANYIVEALTKGATVSEKEPTTKNDLSSGTRKNSQKLEDCISRADARKAIIDHQYSNSFCEEHNIDHSINTGMALIALSDLSPVTPIRPKGHWITRPHVYGVTYCSECDFELKIDDTNFCPNCGADMRAESEEKNEQTLDR